MFGGSSGIFPAIVAVGTIVLFYKGGELADSDRIGGRRGPLWGAASAGLWLLTIFVAGWGLKGGLLLQGVLFAGLTVWGALRSGEGNRGDD